NERANSEDHTMTGGIVAQLNEHIRTYAEEKGYDLILLQTPDVPNVGYAGKRVDITEQVLEYANRKYNYGH
ncbi:MAG: OmpH family outer membrane protein, partial [Saprospiraceae bacterium]